jgi:hypothetical protein
MIPIKPSLVNMKSETLGLTDFFGINVKPPIVDSISNACIGSVYCVREHLAFIGFVIVHTNDSIDDISRLVNKN